MITPEEISKKAEEYSEKLKDFGYNYSDMTEGFIDGAKWAIDKMDKQTKIGDKVWVGCVKCQVLHIPNGLNNIYTVQPIDYHETIGTGCGNARDFSPKEFDKECLPILESEPKTIQEAHQQAAEEHFRLITDKKSQFYTGGGDPEINELLEKLRKEPIDGFDTPPNKYSLELASKVKYQSVSELIKNADVIYRYLTR